MLRYKAFNRNLQQSQAGISSFSYLTQSATLLNVGLFKKRLPTKVKRGVAIVEATSASNSLRRGRDGSPKFLAIFPSVESPFIRPSAVYIKVGVKKDFFFFVFFWEVLIEIKIYGVHYNQGTIA